MFLNRGITEVIKVLAPVSISSIYYQINNSKPRFKNKYENQASLS